MTLKKSREKLERELAEANVKAEQCRHQIQRLENRIRYCTEDKR